LKSKDYQDIKEQMNEAVESLKLSLNSNDENNELWDNFTCKDWRQRDDFIINLKQKQAENRLETKRNVKEKFKAS